MNANLHRGITLAVTYWVAVIIIAHFFAPPGYTWSNNTISELASQGHTYKWIMQAGMIGFGMLMILAAGLEIIKTKQWINPLLLVALYGLAILLAGMYCTAPIDPSISYSVSESQLHSVFATLAGVLLSAAIFWRVMIVSDPRERLVHSIFLVAVIGLSAFYGMAENAMIAIGKGIVQRLLYLGGFAWLVSLRYAISSLPGRSQSFLFTSAQVNKR
jgi:hypothetical membrane protein